MRKQKLPNDLWSLLRKRFPEGEYVLLREVRDRAGFGASRSADGIAMNLWPSRGLEIHGLEIKSYRGDWLRELKNPQKAEAVFQFCDRWWIVADKLGLVDKSEIPKTWGLLVVKNDKVYTEIEAPKLKPVPIDRSFLASLLKRATNGMIPRHSIAEEIRLAREEAEKSVAIEIQELKGDIGTLNKTIATFEEQSGVRISEWNTEDIGKAVKIVLDGGTEHLKKQLRQLQMISAKITQDIARAVSELEHSKKGV